MQHRINACTRTSGVILHPTSLPGPMGSGELGAEARSFVDFLARAGLGIWQVLPVVPVQEDWFSPYSGLSAFGGNPYMLSLGDLVAQGLLDAEDLRGAPVFRGDRVEFHKVAEHRKPLYRKLAHRISESDQRLLAFASAQSQWLEDYALFCALLEEQGRESWAAWPEDLRLRHPAALRAARERLAPALHRHRVLQFLFAQQWGALRNYAHERGVAIVGDIPIYVNYNSADVWANPRYFQLEPTSMKATYEAGVPADGFFSDEAQHWGNPLYDWARMAADDFGWWAARLRHAFEVYDHVRIDHFRGFQAYWAVPAGRPAAEGAWQDGPGLAFFDAMKRHLREVPMFAEDLGLITEDVHKLRRDAGLPGMSVVQFGFKQPGDSPYLPHHAGASTVYYTGTHDVPPLAEWRESLSHAELRRVLEYLGKTPDDAARGEFHWDVLRAAWATASPWVIAQLQDLLGSGAESRMNRPGLADLVNWSWRVDAAHLSDELADRCARLNHTYARGPR